MKLMMKFTCVCTISLNFEIYFPEFPSEIVFGVISDNYALRLVGVNVA